MANAPDNGEQPVLGVKSCLRNTIELFRARFGFFAGVGVATTLLTIVPAYLLQQSITAVSDGGHAFSSPRSDEQLLVLLWDVPVSLIVGSFSSAMVVMGAYDVRTGQPIDWRDYFRASLQQIVPLVWMSFVSDLLVVAGVVMLVVPGLWLLGMFSVVIPAVVVDRAGFGALGRSRLLTKGYRWPIVGFIALVSIVFLVEELILMGPEALLGRTMPFLIIKVVFDGAIAAIGPIAAAVLHMRLREIKEDSGIPA